jgi:hypothetical protein
MSGQKKLLFVAFFAFSSKSKMKTTAKCGFARNLQEKKRHLGEKRNSMLRNKMQ